MSIPTALACKVPAVLDSPAKPPMMKTQDEIDSSPSEGLPFISMTSGSGSSTSPPSLKDQRHHADANTIGSCSQERDGCTPCENASMPVGKVGMEPWRSSMANRVMKSVPTFV